METMEVKKTRKSRAKMNVGRKVALVLEILSGGEYGFIEEREKVPAADLVRWVEVYKKAGKLALTRPRRAKKI